MKNDFIYKYKVWRTFVIHIPFPEGLKVGPIEFLKAEDCTTITCFW